MSARDDARLGGGGGWGGFWKIIFFRARIRRLGWGAQRWAISGRQASGQPGGRMEIFSSGLRPHVPSLAVRYWATKKKKGQSTLANQTMFYRVNLKKRAGMLRSRVPKNMETTGGQAKPPGFSPHSAVGRLAKKRSRNGLPCGTPRAP